MARAGASVVVADINSTTAKSAVDAVLGESGKAIAIETDVSDVESVVRMVERITEEFGHIDILVNNAAVFDRADWMELSEEQWDRVLNTNLKGTLFCSQHAGLAMAKNGGGSIINISSVAAVLPTPDYIAYGASKAAICQLTKSFALVMAKYKIRVNAIAPGIVRTPMNETILSEPGAESERLRLIPLGRIGNAEDVASVAIFLASSEASYITGTTVFVDGGNLLLR
jgi:NAD(P)-dependent dehydrogenase (short-subunit alcohol dehydrogenase family)